MLVLQLAPATGTSELLWQQEAAQVTQAMLARGYKQMAAAWRNFYPHFHIQHPTVSVKGALSVFAAEEVAHGLANTLPAVTEIIGNQLPQAAGKAGENTMKKFSLPNPLTAIGDFFHRLTEGSTWVRVGEVVAGMLLLYIGLKATMTPGGVSVASQNVKSTAKRSGKLLSSGIGRLTPAGRATRTIARHKQRTATAETRRQAKNIRAKRKEFGRRELYRP